MKPSLLAGWEVPATNTPAEITHPSPVGSDTPALQEGRGIEDQGCATQPRNPQHWQPGTSAPPMSLPCQCHTPAALAPSAATAAICRLSFSPQSEAESTEGPGGCFVTSSGPPLSFSLHQPLPLLET